MRQALWFLLLPAFTGCLVTPAEDTSRLTLELSFAQTPVITRQSPDSWFIQATLSGADLDRSLEATARGLAGSDADLTFTTQSGGPRRLTLTYFFYTGEIVETWTFAGSDFYLVPGDQTMTAVLQRAPEYTLDGTLDLPGGLPAQVWLEDLSTELNFPIAAVVPVDEWHGTFSIPHVPVGRFFRLHVRDASNEVVSFDQCPVFSSRTGTLAFAGDLADLSCELP
ncbi:MAG: hypothetical protein CVU59_00995 [Deltaproteobacteria bacterium HGW-Deltaproteobacteria-17]|nr:MAG: hypothetical protein CVU59_00995 [Deltaproteobacteria bacterium HGW-Deltaproteobacteria-17]